MPQKQEMKKQIEQDNKFHMLRRKTHPVTDYHDFLGIDSTKEKCDYFNTGTIYANAAECKKCGWYIRSRNKHDMVSCRCGAISVDGGSHYLKRSGNYEDVIERSVLFNWAQEEQRQRDLERRDG